MAESSSPLHNSPETGEFVAVSAELAAIRVEAVLAVLGGLDVVAVSVRFGFAPADLRDWVQRFVHAGREHLVGLFSQHVEHGSGPVVAPRSTTLNGSSTAQLLLQLPVSIRNLTSRPWIDQRKRVERVRMLLDVGTSVVSLLGVPGIGKSRLALQTLLCGESLGHMLDRVYWLDCSESFVVDEAVRGMIVVLDGLPAADTSTPLASDELFKLRKAVGQALQHGATTVLITAGIPIGLTGEVNVLVEPLTIGEALFVAKESANNPDEALAAELVGRFGCHPGRLWGEYREPNLHVNRQARRYLALLTPPLRQLVGRIASFSGSPTLAQLLSMVQFTQLTPGEWDGQPLGAVHSLEQLAHIGAVCFVDPSGNSTSGANLSQGAAHSLSRAQQAPTSDRRMLAPGDKDRELSIVVELAAVLKTLVHHDAQSLAADFAAWVSGVGETQPEVDGELDHAVEMCLRYGLLDHAVTCVLLPKFLRSGDVIIRLGLVDQIRAHIPQQRRIRLDGAKQRLVQRLGRGPDVPTVIATARQSGSQLALLEAWIATIRRLDPGIRAYQMGEEIQAELATMVATPETLPALCEITALIACFAAREGVFYEELMAKAEGFAYASGSRLMVGRVKSWRSFFSALIGDVHRSFREQQAALEVAQSCGDVVTEMTGYGNLGCLAQELGDYPGALESFQHAIHLAGKHHDRRCKVVFSGFRGLLHLELNQKDKAIHCLRVAVTEGGGETTAFEQLFEAALELLELEINGLPRTQRPIHPDRSQEMVLGCELFGRAAKMIQAGHALRHGGLEVARQYVQQARICLAPGIYPDSVRLAQRIHALYIGTGEVLYLGPEAIWLARQCGPQEDLERHKMPRRLLHALVQNHRLRKGTTPTVAELTEWTWPGERIQYGAAVMRIKAVVKFLRNHGLGSDLEAHEGGYRLRPALVVVSA